MKYRVKTPSIRVLRRHALRAQALIGRHGFGRGLNKVKNILEHLGYIQIDTISVVERAHNHTMWSRTSEFEKNDFNLLIKRHEAFEYWSHAASYLPMRDYPFSLRAKNRRRGRAQQGKEAKRLRSFVLDRIRAEGPLSSKDFIEPRHKHHGWWDWKPSKRALETLYMQGDLMVSERIGFTKQYDLPDNLLAGDIPVSEPKLCELAGHLVETTLAAHGFAELRTINRSRNDGELRQAISDDIDKKIKSNRLIQFELNRSHFFAKPSVIEPIRKPAQKVHILSPFDNSTIHRYRTGNIFDYDYTLECYVPEKKRVWGYYCLPILYGDQFVGRVDCKAHRTEKRFEIKNLHVEKEVDEQFYAKFVKAIEQYAVFSSCDFVTTSQQTPTIFQQLFKEHMR